MRLKQSLRLANCRCHQALVLLFLSWLVFAGVSKADASSQKIHVAVLEPQVTAGQNPQDNTLAMTLDSLLLERLGSLDDVIMVDRQSIDAVLNERELRLSGLVDPASRSKVALDQLPPAMAQFFAAGLLVVSQIDPAIRSVTIEVIVAQNGRLLGSLQWQLEKRDADAMKQMVDAKLPAFWEQLNNTLRETSGRPSVEVAVQLGDGRERLRWLADDAVQSVRASVSLMRHVTLLTARRPLVTKEERLLRVAGLSAAADGDAAALLRASPDVMVTLSVAEGDAIGKTFSQTPVTLHATIGFRDQPATTASDFNGLAGEWAGVVRELNEWVSETLDKGPLAATGVKQTAAPLTPALTDDERARDMAAQLMASIEPWTRLEWFALRQLPADLQRRLGDVALRASHLDPTSETAAWLTAMTLELGKQENDNARGYPNFGRSARLELQRYLDRFGGKHLLHHRDVLSRSTSFVAIWDLLDAFNNKTALLEPPDVARFEQVRQYVRAQAMWGALSLADKRYLGSNVHVIFTHSLITLLIPNIPEDQLEQEYQWWQHFYATRIDVLPADKRPNRDGGIVAKPWELAQAAFAVRRREPQAVRRHLQQVADRFPLNITSIWGSSRDSRKPLIVPIYLKASGDPDWQTWQPVFEATETKQVTLDDMTVMMLDARAEVPAVWAYDSRLPLPGMALPVPEPMRAAPHDTREKEYRSVEAMLQTGDTFWFTSPGMPLGNSDMPQKLFVATLQPGGDATSAALNAHMIALPGFAANDENPSWVMGHAVKDDRGTVVFMGSEKDGILRLEKIEGQWTSRWLNTKNGLPSNSISNLATCMRDGSPHLLVMTSDTVREANHVFSRWNTFDVDIRSDACTLLFESKSKYVGSVVGMKNGSLRLLTMSGSHAYPDPVVVNDIADFKEDTGFTWAPWRSPWPYTISDDPERLVRIWAPGSDMYNRVHHLNEYDSKTLQKRKGFSPGRGSAKGVSVAVDASIRYVISPIMSWPGTDSTMIIQPWPCLDYEQGVGGGRILWLLAPSGSFSGRSTTIVGYRPAPLDSKDWAADDQWIGPFHTPDHQYILGFREAQKAGQFLLSTVSQSMLLDENQMLEHARKAGAVQSTRQWREEYLTRLAKSGWQCHVPALMLDGKHQKALELLDKLLTHTPEADADKPSPMIVALWKARVLADMPERLNDAIAAYDQIARSQRVSPAMEVFAQGNQFILLVRAKRWQEVIDVGTQMQKRFPQVTADDSRGSLASHIAKAKLAIQKQAAESSTHEVTPTEEK